MYRSFSARASANTPLRYLYKIVAVADIGLLEGVHPAGHHAPNLEPEAAPTLGPLQARVQGSMQRGQLTQLPKHWTKSEMPKLSYINLFTDIVLHNITFVKPEDLFRIQLQIFGVSNLDPTHII